MIFDLKCLVYAGYSSGQFYSPTVVAKFSLMYIKAYTILYTFKLGAVNFLRHLNACFTFHHISPRGVLRQYFKDREMYAASPI